MTARETDPTPDGTTTAERPDTTGRTNGVDRLEGPSGPTIGGPQADVAAALAAATGSRRQRGWPMLLLGLAIGAGGVWLASRVLAGGEDDGAEQAAEPLQLATATVEQGDLVEEIEWAGTLGYGSPVPITGTENGTTGAGTVTATVDPGTIVERGDVLVRVANEPVVVFYGAAPMWRTLSEGDAGSDVLLLESNLVALGYDPDETVDIDETFTATTAAMVERWQDDLGVEATGTVEPGSVAVVEGRSAVVDVAHIGSSAGGTIATLAPQEAVTDVVASADGTIGDLAATGTTIEHGSIAYTVDGAPVTALTAASADDAVAKVLVGGTFTTTELEQALADGGYDPDGTMTVDGVVTDATTAAVERWRAAAGLPPTGDAPTSADPAYYLLVPDGLTVDSHLVDEGTVVVGGGPVMTLAVSRLSVTITVEVAEADEFEIGDAVEIELADESTVAGVIAQIGAVEQADPGAQSGPTVDITVDVVAESGQELIDGPVTVVSVGQAVRGATLVPTRALVSLSEGGFAVEKVAADGSTSLVGVEIGVFDDGLVEVTEGELAPGDAVVVPR